MPFFGSMPFGGQQFANPQQSAQAALAPAQVVANALMGPLARQEQFAQQGGVRSAQDARDLARVGSADATLSNIGQALNTGMGLMGGMGALKSVAKMGLSKLGIGENPFSDLAGFARTTPANMATITSNNPQQALNQARAAQARSHAEAHAKSEAAKESRAERGRVARGV